MAKVYKSKGGLSHCCHGSGECCSKSLLHFQGNMIWSIFETATAGKKFCVAWREAQRKAFCLVLRNRYYQAYGWKATLWTWHRWAKLWVPCRKLQASYVRLGLTIIRWMTSVSSVFDCRYDTTISHMIVSWTTLHVAQQRLQISYWPSQHGCGLLYLADTQDIQKSCRSHVQTPFLQRSRSSSD